MTKEPTLVRASDIGQWAFCHRAWWLARVQQAEHQAPARLQRGEQMHVAHGRTVTVARWLQQAGLVLIGLAFLLFVCGIAFWCLSA